MKTFLQPLIDFWQANSSHIVTAILIFAVGLIVIRLFCDTTSKALKKSPLNVTLHHFILSALKIVLYLVLAITILQVFNVPMTSVLATLSVVGLAVSLSVQNSLANVAGGVTLLFARPFEVGDYIQFNGVEGVVERISIVNTKLCTIDNKVVYIPNGNLSQDKIVNFTTAGTRRLDLDISVSYDNDFRFAMKLMEQVIDKETLIIKDQDDKLPMVRMVNHGESALILGAKVWVNAADYWTVRSNMLEEFKDIFDANGIVIPYNQLQISLRKD